MYRKISSQNAEKVKNSLLSEIITLASYPAKYSPDKYKLNNDNSFRAFELYKYRISYRSYIVISYSALVSHTNQNYSTIEMVPEGTNHGGGREASEGLR